MFKKILVPSDLSEQSLASIRAAVELARALDSELILLNVHPEFMRKGELEMLRVSTQEFLKDEKEIAVTAKSRLEELLKLAGGGDLPYKILLREGNHRDEILATGDENQCDLIIITTTGRTHLREHLHGSDSEQLVRDTQIPILVIPVSKQE
ncbi:MAG: universal stress protein [bacterium]|nr:universal stress protein [bacterium]